MSVYGARATAGVFAAAVLPVHLAWVREVSTSRTQARAFAWLSAISALGFLFVPVMNGWLASMATVAPDDALTIPFYAATAMEVVVWFAAYRLLPESAPMRIHDSVSTRITPPLL